jgi:hypothetical protein
MSGFRDSFAKLSHQSKDVFTFCCATLSFKTGIKESFFQLVDRTSSHPSLITSAQHFNLFLFLSYQIYLLSSFKLVSSDKFIFTMHFSTAATILFALGSNVAHSYPLTYRQSNPPTLNEIQTAQSEWSSDTTKVSQFLSVAESLSPEDLVAQAETAFTNEYDELYHKAVLDNQFVFVANPDANVQQANNELVDQGTFNVVLAGLQNLKANGLNMTPDEVSSLIQSINGDRCSFVLPSIDTYFQAAENLLGSAVTLTANRPTNC